MLSCVFRCSHLYLFFSLLLQCVRLGENVDLRQCGGELSIRVAVAYRTMKLLEYCTVAEFPVVWSFGEWLMLDACWRQRLERQ